MSEHEIYDFYAGVKWSGMKLSKRAKKKFDLFCQIFVVAKCKICGITWWGVGDRAHIVPPQKGGPLCFHKPRLLAAVVVTYTPLLNHITSAARLGRK